MAAERTASVTWQGDLAKGSGVITGSGSGVLANLPVTWAARTEASGGKTSPEELIAAAHAACYCMALSYGLGNAGTPPSRLEVSVTNTFQPGAGFIKAHIQVRGTVPGLDAAAFLEAAEGAKENCPVSKALKGNVELSLDARLVS